jgi:MFS family permease
MHNPASTTNSQRKAAYLIIILFGIVSLFGDVIYEGARSVTGPYLYILGGSALVVGFVAGFGEFLGYALRLVSGYLADTTGRYWTLTFIGYGMLIAVPFLALAGSWELAAMLFIVERMGKGIRAPAKDTILSNVTICVGRGWGFAIHEACDQIGAIVGPLIFTAAYLLRGDFRYGFALLAIPFVLMMLTLLLARTKAPDPSLFEAATEAHPHVPPPRALIPFGIFTALTMIGFAAFPLIAFHFTSAGIVPDAQIPLFYAIAMGTDALVALAVGRAYDRYGLRILGILPLIGIFIPFAAFGTDYSLAIFAVVLWGASMGIQETILRAAIADYTHISTRGRAYGVFNTIYGSAWFLGSVVIGWAYEVSLVSVMGFMAVMQGMAAGAFIWAKRGLEAGECRVDAT